MQFPWFDSGSTCWNKSYHSGVMGCQICVNRQFEANVSKHYPEQLIPDPCRIFESVVPRSFLFIFIPGEIPKTKFIAPNEINVILVQWQGDARDVLHATGPSRAFISFKLFRIWKRHGLFHTTISPLTSEATNSKALLKQDINYR